MPLASSTSYTAQTTAVSASYTAPASSSSSKPKKPSSAETEAKTVSKAEFKQHISTTVIKHVNKVRSLVGWFVGWVPNNICAHLLACSLSHALSQYFSQKRIASKDDFKHVCRKLTHVVIDKEVKTTKEGESAETYKLDAKVDRKIEKLVDSFFEKLGTDGVYQVRFKLLLLLLLLLCRRYCSLTPGCVARCSVRDTASECSGLRARLCNTIRLS